MKKIGIYMLMVSFFSLSAMDKLSGMKIAALLNEVDQEPIQHNFVGKATTSQSRVHKDKKRTNADIEDAIRYHYEHCEKYKQSTKTERFFCGNKDCDKNKDEWYSTLYSLKRHQKNEKKNGCMRCFYCNDAIPMNNLIFNQISNQKAHKNRSNNQTKRIKMRVDEHYRRCSNYQKRTPKADLICGCKEETFPSDRLHNLKRHQIKGTSLDCSRCYYCEQQIDENNESHSVLELNSVRERDIVPEVTHDIDTVLNDHDELCDEEDVEPTFVGDLEKVLNDHYASCDAYVEYEKKKDFRCGNCYSVSFKKQANLITHQKKKNHLTCEYCKMDIV